MAFDLRARLSIDGNQFTTGMNRASRAVDQLGRSTQRAHRDTGRLSDGFRAIGRSVGGVAKLTGAFTGLGAAIGGAAAANKLFHETIVAAARAEQSSVIINAMFNDKKLGKQYLDFVDKFAVDSPIFNSQDMLGNSKSFITITKDMKKLEKLWDLAQRMAAIDPHQGLEGAVFALRELASGDAISMVRRFEMPKKVMNEIKKMDLPEQLKALDKYFSSIGMTQHLITEMGGSTIGIWSQIREKIQVILRDMGKPALMVLKNFIDGINKGISGGSLEGFKQTGANIIKNIATGFVNAATGIGKWMSSIQNSEEFKKATSLAAKVDFVFSDIGQRFAQWLESGGQDKLNAAAKQMILIVSAGLMANEGTITSTATAIGTAVGSALFSSMSSSFFDKWSGSKLMNIPGMKPFKWVATAGRKVGQYLFPSGQEDNGKSHASGLTRVPYNGYKATLHRNEQILTPEASKEYNSGKSKGAYHITVNVNGQIADQRTVDTLLDAMVTKIHAAGLAGA
jgi:hypothetical protein